MRASACARADGSSSQRLISASQRGRALSAARSGNAPRLPARDTATTLATAVAVAEVPRRAVERRTGRAQQQRAATRSRRAAVADSPMRVAAAAPAMQVSAPLMPAAGDVQPSAPVTALFAAEPVQPRPWPRAVLPGFAADSAFSASYGRSRQEHPFHPFEPRVELEPMPAQQPPAASGPR